jgi:hypothetical protein
LGYQVKIPPIKDEALIVEAAVERLGEPFKSPDLESLRWHLEALLKSEVAYGMPSTYAVSLAEGILDVEA